MMSLKKLFHSAPSGVSTQVPTDTNAPAVPSPSALQAGPRGEAVAADSPAATVATAPDIQGDRARAAVADSYIGYDGDPFDCHDQRRITGSTLLALDCLAAMHAVDLRRVVATEHNGEIEELTEAGAVWTLANFELILDRHAALADPVAVVINEHRERDLQARVAHLEAALRTLDARAGIWQCHERRELRAAGESVRRVTQEALGGAA